MLHFMPKCRHWVFDMDGTLTRPVHDFQYIRQQLEIPPQADILEHLAGLPACEAKLRRDWLYQHEYKLAASAGIAAGARELVSFLSATGCQLAILTRNDRQLADVTLEAIGLRPFFQSKAIYGRDQAIPKPSPDGLLKIARHWQTSPEQLIMVGDFHFDLTCARAAGTRNILINETGNLWPELADFHTPDCISLLHHLNTH